MLGACLHYRFPEVKLIGQKLDMYILLLVIAKFPFREMVLFTAARPPLFYLALTVNMTQIRITWSVGETLS